MSSRKYEGDRQSKNSGGGNGSNMSKNCNNCDTAYDRYCKARDDVDEAKRRVASLRDASKKLDEKNRAMNQMLSRVFNKADEGSSSRDKSVDDLNKKMKNFKSK